MVAVLDRYEQVDRYQSVNGFAFVEAKGNVAGWIPESQLLERRPVARKPTEQPETPGDVTEDSPPEEASPAPDTAGTVDEAPAPPATEPTEPERSVFDPY